MDFHKCPLPARMDVSDVILPEVKGQSVIVILYIAFVGYRYIKDNDPAVILLFDKNGYIAGIQTMVCAPLPTPTPYPFPYI